MRTLLLILSALALAACSGYPYAVKDGGDGVYYAESPPTYTYVNGFFGFPYHGPYSWAWYYPVWYSPLYGPHYSWYRPYYHWSDPFPVYSGRYTAYHPPPVGAQQKKRKNRSSAPGIYPVLPADLRPVTVGPTMPRYSLKSAAYGSPTIKSRMAAKSSKPTYHAPSRTASPSYRSAPRASSPAPTRQRSVRQASRDIQ